MKKFFSFVILLSLFGCAEEVIEKPEDLISREKMTDIIYDIALLQAIKSTNESMANEFDSQVMQLVYKIHDIDSAQFVSSDLYYASIPLQYEGIYQEVDSRLEKEKERINEERKKKSDSARKSVQSRTDSLKTIIKPKNVSDNLLEKVEK